MAHGGEPYGGLEPATGEAIPQAVIDAGLTLVRVRADSDRKEVIVYVESGEQAALDSARIDAQAVAPDEWTVKVRLWS